MGCISKKGPVKGVCKSDVTIPDIPASKITAPTAETVTEAKIDGKGIFDLYMRAGIVHLKEEYKEGKIKGADYAKAYIGMMELMMTEANKLALGLFSAQIEAEKFAVEFETFKYKLAEAKISISKVDAESRLVCQQVAELEANGETDRELKCAQTKAQEKTVELYTRQIKGFDDKFQTDVYKIVMDAWAAQGAEITTTPADSTLSSLTRTGLEDQAPSAVSTSVIGEMFKKAGIT